MKRHHHKHLKLSYIIILIALAASGAWLFLRPGPAAPPEIPSYLSAPGSQPGSEVTVLLFPNATSTVNLTLNRPTTGARISISGRANGLTAALGGKTILASRGSLTGKTYVIDNAAPTLYDLRDAPFNDMNSNGIADDYEMRHALSPSQISGKDSIDKMSPLDKYLYYARTRREIDPLRIDTDMDGYEDSTEVLIGTDPTNWEDSPIQSFPEKPYFFAQNEIYNDKNILTYWSFDVPGMDTMKRAPLTLLNNTHLEPGPDGMALHLDNKSEGARASPNPSFSRLEDFTLAAWISTLDNRSRYILHLTSPEGSHAASMDFGSSMPACSVTIDNITYTARSRRWRILADDWNHYIICVRDRSSLTLYVDGKEEDRTETPGGTILAGGRITIGAEEDSVNQFYHLIDSVAVYSTSMNKSRIDRLYKIMYDGQDFDADGQGDPWEVRFGLSPRVPSDAKRDDDMDGLVNLEEYQYYLLTGRMMDPKAPDTDYDGYSDLAEKDAGTDPTNPADRPGMPIDTSRDSDRDGMPDWWELRYGLQIRVDDSLDDNDKDGLQNIEEYSYYIGNGRMISPIDADSNRNGIKDGEEIKRAADPSSVPDRTVWLNLPGRIQFDIPSKAEIIAGKMTVKSGPRIVLANQEEDAEYIASGTADITRLLGTRCATTNCRNVLKARSERTDNNSKTILDRFEIRYRLEPESIDPLPTCPEYPCTIPLTLRSESPGNITVTMDGAKECDQECLAGAHLECGTDVTCEIDGRIAKAKTPEELLRGSPAEAEDPLQRGRVILIAIGAVACGLGLALINAALSKKRKQSPKAIEHYVSEAQGFLDREIKKGQSIEYAMAKLIGSGWPKQYVEEAAKRMKR